MRNKSLLRFGLALLLLTPSCKTWDATLIAPSSDALEPRLLTLERRVEDLTGINPFQNSLYEFRLNDELNLFTREVEENLIDPYGDKYGYISLQRSIIDVRYGLGNVLFSTLLFTVPNVFGMPFMNIRYKLAVEMRILDSQHRLIGKYSAIGESRVLVAYYYGYSLRSGNADRKAYTDALNHALDQIRPQIRRDTERLNQALRAAGPLYGW